MLTKEVMASRNAGEQKKFGGVKKMCKKIGHYFYVRRFVITYLFIVCTMFAFQNPQNATVVEKVTDGVISTSIVAHADKNSTKDSSSNTAGTNTFDTTLEWVAAWVVKLGGVVMFVGVIEVGYGFVKDNPGAKTQGWQFIVGGGIIAGAGLSYTQFIA